MAVYFNGTKLNWYDADIIVNGTTISSNENLKDVYHNGTKVHGSSGFASETQLYNFGLAPDSGTFENTYIPTLLNTYGAAFEANVFQTGLPGSDTRWYIKLHRGYRMVTSDGTFLGGDENTTTSYNGVAYTCYLWEGRTVTGANTSHNGGTSVSLRRDNGV
jgi:hypothetical protein